jgi:serine/threonine protein kinase
LNMAALEETTEGYAQKNFVVEKFLGKGSYGSVYKVKRLSDGNTYAFKESNIKHMSQEERQDAVNEIRLLASIKHEQVIAYYEAFVDGNKLCIVMEYCEQGDLAKCIKRRAQQRKYFPEEQIWSYFIQICRGLVGLHAARIIHRDIKSANIMRPDSNIVKIGDLGVAKVLKGTMTKTQIGTPHYMPPEVWRNKPYTFSSDVWALGCLLYEMATFNVPFEAKSLSELRFKVIKGVYPPIPSVYSPEMSAILRELLNLDPSTRFSAEQVLNHPIVQARMHLAPAPPSQLASHPSGSLMLATIQVPQNLRMLKARLPKPSYPATTSQQPGLGSQLGQQQQKKEHPEIIGSKIDRHHSALPSAQGPARRLSDGNAPPARRRSSGGAAGPGRPPVNRVPSAGRVPPPSANKQPSPQGMGIPGVRILSAGVAHVQGSKAPPPQRVPSRSNLQGGGRPSIQGPPRSGRASPSS